MSHPLTEISTAQQSDQTDNKYDPREKAIRREQREQVERALAQLSDEMRQTVLLRIDGDLTFKEIAEQMQCSLNRCQKHTFRKRDRPL